MRNLGSSVRAIAILAGAGAAAFAVSTAAVSSATTKPSLPQAVKYPFASFSFTGGVSTSRPSRPATFSLTFTTSFKLAANSPGITDPATGTLQTVTVEEHVSYPVPAAGAAPQLVGPAQLPFGSDKLTLVVAIKGTCFISQPNGSFVFRGSLTCASSTLKLGLKTYKVSALLTSITGSFTPNPAGGPGWTGSLRAAFKSPGYTFPIATLGSGGNTSLLIGSNGGTVATRSIVFAG